MATTKFQKDIKNGQLSVDCNEMLYIGVFQVADYEFDIFFGKTTEVFKKHQKSPILSVDSHMM